MASSGLRPSGLPVGTEQAGRELWLWKVPAFVSDSWSAARPGADLGRLTVKVYPGGPQSRPPAINVVVGPEALAQAPGGLSGPTDYEVNVTEVPPTQIFSEVMRKRHRDEEEEEGSSCAVFGGGATAVGTVTAEGFVARKGDMRPVRVEQKYRNLVRARMEGSLDRTAIRAMGAHESQRLGHKANKAPGGGAMPYAATLAGSRSHARPKGKKVGVDTDFGALEASLFVAYDEKELWSLKDLSDRLQKPAHVVREVLDKIASQWREGAEAGWRLRPEYRATGMQPNTASNSS